MTKEHGRWLWVSAASVLALSGVAMAAPPDPLQDRPKPPQAAFDACRSKGEGDACSVEFHGRTITGTCRKLPDGGSDLICMPAGPPPGPPPS